MSVLTMPRQVQAKGDDAYTNNELWNALTKLIGQLNGIPILDGRIVGPVTLAAGVPQAIPHGLGRPFQGWWPTRLSYPGATDVVQEASSTTPSSSIRLQCAQAVTLSFWVF